MTLAFKKNVSSPTPYQNANSAAQHELVAWDDVGGMQERRSSTTDLGRRLEAVEIYFVSRGDPLNHI